MQHIVDVSEVLLELGLSDSATEEERAVVITSLKRAEGAVRRFLGYDPVKAERTEYYPQRRIGSQRRGGSWEVEGDQAVYRQLSEDATNLLQLKHIPVRSITSLRIDYSGRSGTADGSFGTDTEKTQGSDYWTNIDAVDSEGEGVCLDGLLNGFGSWPLQPGTGQCGSNAGVISQSGGNGAPGRCCP